MCFYCHSRFTFSYCCDGAIGVNRFLEYFFYLLSNTFLNTTTLFIALCYVTPSTIDKPVNKEHKNDCHVTTNG